MTTTADLELDVVRSGIERTRLDGLVERSRDRAVRVEAMTAHVRGGAFDPTAVQTGQDRS